MYYVSSRQTSSPSNNYIKVYLSFAFHEVETGRGHPKYTVLSAESEWESEKKVNKLIQTLLGIHKQDKHSHTKFKHMMFVDAELPKTHHIHKI